MPRSYDQHIGPIGVPASDGEAAAYVARRLAELRALDLGPDDIRGGDEDEARAEVAQIAVRVMAEDYARQFLRQEFESLPPRAQALIIRDQGGWRR